MDLLTGVCIRIHVEKPADGGNVSGGNCVVSNPDVTRAKKVHDTTVLLEGIDTERGADEHVMMRSTAVGRFIAFGEIFSERGWWEVSSGSNGGGSGIWIEWKNLESGIGIAEGIEEND